MPWCETCSKFWAPTAMNPDGTCPTCGRELPKAAADPVPASPDGAGSVADDASSPPPEAPIHTAANLDLKEMAGEEGRTPWHFKVLIVALVLYLGWRLWELVVWLLNR